MDEASKELGGHLQYAREFCRICELGYNSPLGTAWGELAIHSYAEILYQYYYCLENMEIVWWVVRDPTL